MSAELTARLNQDVEPQRSSMDIMLEILREVYPIPQPPKDVPWLNKSPEELTEAEEKAQWDFMMLQQRAIADTPTWIPEDHPRYAEFEAAERKYESMFRISPEDLLRPFDI